MNQSESDNVVRDEKAAGVSRSPGNLGSPEARHPSMSEKSYPGEKEAATKTFQDPAAHPATEKSTDSKSEKAKQEAAAKEAAAPKLVGHQTSNLPAFIAEPAVVAPSTKAPVDPNAGVKINIVEAGKEYKISGIGPDTTISFASVTEESLIAVLLDRLGASNPSRTGSGWDTHAAGKLEEALNFLHQRTRDRVSRGVEGTTQR
jgi:hypothetical protein